jgi:OOP family OmpA-OmpF porin
MSRILLVIGAFLIWAAGSTWWYTSNLTRVSAADEGTVTQTASAQDGKPITVTPISETASVPAVATISAPAKSTPPLGAAKSEPLRVLFPIRKSKRHPSEKTALKLKEIAEQLKVSGRVIVTGFTDARGSEDMNMTLAKSRAESVRDELIRLGAPAELIEVAAVGEQTPYAENNTIMGRQLNRRVEVTVH